MDPYTHLLCLPSTFSCQTTFIPGSPEIMNCVCPFLDYIDCTTITGIHIHTQYHNPCEFARVNCGDAFSHPFIFSIFDSDGRKTKIFIETA